MNAAADLRDQRIRFRGELIDVLRRELIGPEPYFGRPSESTPPISETLLESPVQRYSAGVLFPTRKPINEVETEAESVSEDADSSARPEIFAEEQLGTNDRSGGE